MTVEALKVGPVDVGQFFGGVCLVLAIFALWYLAYRWAFSESRQYCKDVADESKGLVAATLARSQEQAEREAARLRAEGPTAVRASTGRTPNSSAGSTRRHRRPAQRHYRLDSLLEFLGVEVPDPVEDDSPEAEAEAPDDDTDEFPAVPCDTEPSGIPVQVHGALIEARDLSGEFPHPVDSAERRAMNAADIEERLKQFNFAGRNR